MNSEEIKANCEKAYSIIRDAEKMLEAIRKECKHENTFEGNWSWRIGSSMPAIICSDCGSLVKFKDMVV